MSFDINNSERFCSCSTLESSENSDNILVLTVNYLKSRRWGLQMLIRLTNQEKLVLRHFIVFCIGALSSLLWADTLISDIKAFIEFRTNILNTVNFTNFDNKIGTKKLIIPNYIHYIRLDQPNIRYEI